MSCSLCPRPPEMFYAVDPEREKPLCGACFGKWSPEVLNGLLGVRPEPAADGAGKGGAP